MRVHVYGTPNMRSTNVIFYTYLCVSDALYNESKSHKKVKQSYLVQLFFAQQALWEKLGKVAKGTARCCGAQRRQLGPELCTSINVFLVTFSRVTVGVLLLCITMACKRITKQLAERSSSGLSTPTKWLLRNGWLGKRQQTDW